MTDSQFEAPADAEAAVAEITNDWDGPVDVDIDGQVDSNDSDDAAVGEFTLDAVVEAELSDAPGGQPEADEAEEAEDEDPHEIGAGHGVAVGRKVGNLLGPQQHWHEGLYLHSRLGVEEMSEGVELVGEAGQGKDGDVDRECAEIHERAHLTDGAGTKPKKH